jgi:hydrogenase expression/formation protein HypD
MALMEEVFTRTDRKWRGLGRIPGSGLELSEPYRSFDAAARFGVSGHSVDESPECLAGSVLTGDLRPDECPEFGTGCTPLKPKGAPMVSNEGACAAYYRYRRRRADADG